MVTLPQLIHSNLLLSLQASDYQMCLMLTHTFLNVVTLLKTGMLLTIDIGINVRLPPSKPLMNLIVYLTVNDILLGYSNLDTVIWLPMWYDIKENSLIRE